MGFALPIDKMTTADKIAAMEMLWEDLCKTPESVPSPSWHKEVLSAREKRVKEGQTQFSSLDAAKQRIKEATR